ncbi:hypothetical protein Y032_1192g3742 [Ancylostoma ceylanicum]|uniref:Protein kinase domain-containing protein n=2 Tax=Ancylostoma ceylanicum TaxID=53326 RepID=A0A016W603_9BILA|nr:hypothetical protein Y032_1192g3742 [Ancylostoma ceylanicum]
MTIPLAGHYVQTFSAFRLPGWLANPLARSPNRPRQIWLYLTSEPPRMGILDVISKSTCGCVYRVLRLEDNKNLAIKCESVKVKTPTLRHEARVYEALKSLVSPHFIALEDRGMVDERFVFVVLRLVGKNLLDLLQEVPDKKFTMVTAVRIAEQALSGIRDLHIVHKFQARKMFNIFSFLFDHYLFSVATYIAI